MAADSSKDWRMPRSARSLAHRLSRQPVTILLLVLGALLVAHNYAPLGGSATAGVAGAQTKAVTSQAAAIAAELAGVARESNSERFVEVVKVVRVGGGGWLGWRGGWR